jgi:hypothetical protein
VDSAIFGECDGFGIGFEEEVADLGISDGGSWFHSRLEMQSELYIISTRWV